MADKRTRSNYRIDVRVDRAMSLPDGCEQLDEQHRAGLAQLMLDAYRGTIDDEDETFEDALEAIDYYLQASIREHSFVLVEDGRPVAMSLVIALDGRHFIDPVAVAASHKRRGLGRQLVMASLASLANVGIREVGATITDGNTASEQLFAGLGAERVGSWPPQGDSAD